MAKRTSRGGSVTGSKMGHIRENRTAIESIWASAREPALCSRA
jgi:hypothetical protein